MSVLNLRDYITRYLPSWLSDNYPASKSYGYRLLWTFGLFVDTALDVMMQGSLGAVGKGTPTALDYIGQARGLIRNQGESDTAYAVRLGTWIDRAKENGTAYRLALAIHDYLESHPMVRVFTRSLEDDSVCITVDTDRTVTQVVTSDFDWDSVSHPERSDSEDPYWSDLWVVVYVTTQWPVRPDTLGDLTGEDGFALGHLATPQEADAIKGLIQQCKAAHSCVRAVIWTTDDERFVPGDPGSMPDGTWGAWSINSGGSQVPSGRDLTTCRFWEPR